MGSHKELETHEYNGHTIIVNGHGYKVITDGKVDFERYWDGCLATESMLQCAKLRIDSPPTPIPEIVHEQ